MVHAGEESGASIGPLADCSSSNEGFDACASVLLGERTDVITRKRIIVPIDRLPIDTANSDVKFLITVSLIKNNLKLTKSGKMSFSDKTIRRFRKGENRYFKYRIKKSKCHRLGIKIDKLNW